MPKYRWWLLEDTEDPEHDSQVDADDSQEAAENACAEMFNDGDSDISNEDRIEIAVRLLPDGRPEMFEIFVDWSPNFTAYSRGELPSPT